MLKHIPPILSPQLLKILMEMGHGDELVLADGNFPAESIGKRVVRLDGHGIPPILDAVLHLFPLDRYDREHAVVMQVVPGDSVETPIWDTFAQLVAEHEPASPGLVHMERFAFYDRAKNAYAVVATGETALYANIILKKGVVAK